MKFLRYIIFVILPMYLFSQSKGNPPKEELKVLKLTLKEAVQQVIEKNVMIQNAKYEILKLDSDYQKSDSQYTWKLLGEAQSFKAKLPVNNLNLFSGTKQSQDKLSIGIEKQFKTGTYFKAEVSTIRFDTNAFESPFTTGMLRMLAIPPLYTGAVTVTLSQELLKYSFGKTDKNKQKMLKSIEVVKREELINQLTGIVAMTLVDYWSLGIADSSIETYEKLLKNAKDIRNLTYNKQGIGLAEKFEANQWNAVIYNIESQLARQKNLREEARAKLVRILNVDPASQITGVTDLVETAPTEINLESDIDYAYQNRIDLLNIQRQKEIARIGLNNARDEDMPSLKFNITYSTKGQTLISPQENFLSTDKGIASLKYPEVRGSINLTYPLWDNAIKTEIRDASVYIRQLDTQEANLKKEIKDELTVRRDMVVKSYQIFLNAKRALKDSEDFYKGVYANFTQGRFQAVQVKNALDAVVQAKLGMIQAKVNYNINLLRYDLAKNYLFAKFGIDINDIIEKALKMRDERNRK